MKLPTEVRILAGQCWELRVKVVSDKLNVDVWQTHYGTKVSSSTFDWALNNEMIKAEYNGALLNVKGSISSVIVPVTLPKPNLSLAHCVGKGDGPCGSQDAKGDGESEEKSIDVAHKLELIDRLCDPEKTPSTNSFLEVWKSFYDPKKIPVKKKQQKNTTVMVNLPKSKQIQLLQRFSSDSAHAFHHTLVQMIDAGLFTTVAAQELCDICVKINNEQLLEEFINKFQNLPEKGLIALVKLYLKKIMTGVEDNQHHFIILTKLTTSDVTQIFFEEELKLLTAEEAVTLLLWLVDIAQSRMGFGEPSKNLEISLEKTLLWIGTLIDVHFSTLAVDKSCTSSLMALNLCLGKCVELKSEADKFSELLTFMGDWAKEKDKTKQKGVDYWIEIVAFD